MESKGRFIGKTAIVTGGAQGIGAAVSQALVDAGANVIIADLDDEAGEEWQRTLGDNARFVHTDVAEENDVAALAKQAAAWHGRIDIVVNNAGIFDAQPLEERSMTEFDRILAVNLRGPYMMAKYCAPHLREANPGVIINIASTRALMSEPDTEPYAASKGGIVALTHSLAVSLGPKVRVNAISPGWIEVSGWKKSAVKQTPQHRPIDLEQHPAGRVGTPADIAAACLFLCDEQAGFITGANLVIDGGMTVKMIYAE